MRFAKINRKTNETDVLVEVDLDEKGCQIATGIPFFDHMLEIFAFHSAIRIVVKAEGDLKHHLIEDVGITLGEAVKKALGEKKGITRFGSAIVPMDESVAICGVDISGRGVFIFDGEVGGAVEGVDSLDLLHFLETFCRVAGINTYISVKGKNTHHIFEAIFKALAISFRNAIRVEGGSVRSTKGYLG